MIKVTNLCTYFVKYNSEIYIYIYIYIIFVVECHLFLYCGLLRCMFDVAMHFMMASTVYYCSLLFCVL